MVIHKQILDFVNNDVCSIRLPMDAEVLCCQMQYNNTLCIWYKWSGAHNTKTVTRVFQIVGTGHNFSDNNKMQYISTVQIDNGAFIFHVFEITK